MTTESMELVSHVLRLVKLAATDWRIVALPALPPNIGFSRLLQLEPAYVQLPITIQAAMFANFARPYALLAGLLPQIVHPVITLSTIAL
jgi:hypothetical protein